MDKQIIFEKIDNAIDLALSKQHDIPEERKHLYTELVKNEREGLYKVAEQTTTANIDRVINVFLPTIKKLVKDSVITNLVGIQPIPDRVTTVEYMDIIYESGPKAGKSMSEPSEFPTDYSIDKGEGETIDNRAEIVFREKEVKAKSRKLAAKWTFEANDAFKKKGYNIETEITKSIASYITREINNEVLLDLLQGATGATATWKAPVAT